MKTQCITSNVTSQLRGIAREGERARAARYKLATITRTARERAELQRQGAKAALRGTMFRTAPT
jgi:hypothetical protein